MKGRLAFVQANNHCMEPTGFKWSYLKMLKPADSFAVPASVSTKAESWNAGVWTAYELGAEWFFLMDVDQLFPKMTIPHLFETAEKYNAKIVCGLYHMKRAPWAPIAGWDRVKDDKTIVAVNVNGNLWKSEFTELNEKNPENPVVEVGWAGTGAMLIHKEVIDAVGWPPFTDIMNEKKGTRDLGHDVNFCIRAREKGYKIYVDTRVDCPHGGFYYFDKAFGKAAKETKFIEHFGAVIQDQTREKEYWDSVWGEEFLKHTSREDQYKETLSDVAGIISSIVLHKQVPLLNEKENKIQEIQKESNDLLLRESAKSGATELPRLPQSILEELEKISSPEQRTKKKEQLSILYAQLCEKGEDQEASLRKLREYIESSASSGLQQSTSSGMVLSAMSHESPQAEKITFADIGCGPGVLLEHIYNGRGIRGTGYDFSEKAIEILKNKGFPGMVVDFRNYSPNGDRASYDSVVSLHTIEHIQDDHKFIELMKSLCKPGGKVVIATPWREEIQNCLEHVHQYSDEDMDARMKSHFTSYEVRKNNRDYIAVGVNS